MKMILNTTKKASERYILIDEGMGCYGEAEYSPTHKYSIVNGCDKGFGFQGYMSITHVLKDYVYFPDIAKKSLINFLVRKGYTRYLKENGL